MKRYFSTGTPHNEDINISSNELGFTSEIACTDNNDILDQFWKEFYEKLEIKTNSYKPSNISIYHNDIFNILKHKKQKNLSDDELKDLQSQIELQTLSFDENIIFKQYPKMINLLIGDCKITAKEYLKSKDIDLEILDHFGCYTLEALIIHVLGLVFSCSNRTSLVKVSTLIDQLDSAVKDQVRFISYENLDKFFNKNKELEVSKKKKKEKVIKNNKDLFKIGSNLVEFMIERDVIILSTEINISDKTIVKEIGKGFKLLNCYVFCNFSLKELPIKLHLPMVYKPNNWVAKVKNPNTLSDISGGYFCNSTIPIINRFSVITSRDLNNFNILLSKTNYLSLLNILNSLQSESFEINKDVLEFILNNRKRLVELELLMPRVLAYTNIKECYDLLRFSFFSNEKVKNSYSLNNLLKELSSRIQKAYYEETVLLLAEAYNGFEFYLPAFMDFRGRIYRTGILHYHERDLARSLIVFSNRNKDKKISKSCNLDEILACAAAFKYKKFKKLSNALEWFKENYSHFESCDSLMNLALGASEPFQFISMIKSILKQNVDYNMIPVTQDASASAYQIMSYILLNKNMGRLTNLLPSEDGLIQDVYMSLMFEFKTYLSTKLNKNKFLIIESMLTRKLVKKLFMPIIYGKKVNSMANDIKSHYGSLLSVKDTYIVAELCNEFWKDKYPDINNLMNLINLIGWFCSKLDRAVMYNIPFFSTVQDYMCREKTYIWVYDNISKKKRKISFIVPTTKRDSRKTQNATCANFIHQKDAYIAMKVVDKLLLKKKGPVYTVHDNFITTSPFVKQVPNIYIDVFKEMGPPLLIINKYVLLNLVFPYINTDWFIKRFSNFNIFFDTPLSSDILEEFLEEIYNFEKLNNNVIKKVSTKKWFEKTSEFVKCYNNYISSVCYNNVDPNDSNLSHINKWIDFETELNKWKNVKYNYCVHV